MPDSKKYRVHKDITKALALHARLEKYYRKPGATTNSRSLIPNHYSYRLIQTEKFTASRIAVLTTISPCAPEDTAYHNLSNAASITAYILAMENSLRILVLTSQTADACPKKPAPILKNFHSHNGDHSFLWRSGNPLKNCSTCRHFPSAPFPITAFR